MNASRNDIAALALRLILGAAFIAHGFPKIQHPVVWAQHVLPGAPGWLAAIDAAVEFGGGIAILAGFGTRIAAFLIAVDMAVAIFFVHLPSGAVFVSSGKGAPSFELPLTYLTIAFALVLVGAGSFSCDEFGANRTAGTYAKSSRGGRR